MNGARLIRNRWVMGVVLALYGTILWGGFHWIYGNEIELQRLARASDTPSPEQAMRAYETISHSRVTRTNLETFVALGDLLERVEHWNEAARIWRRVAAAAPEQEWPRGRLTLALHNAGRYAEAETHFVELLGEGAKQR